MFSVKTIIVQNIILTLTEYFQISKQTYIELFQMPINDLKHVNTHLRLTTVIISLKKIKV